MGSKSGNDAKGDDGASPGKIFIGGLPKDTSLVTFNKYFGKYGDITDSVIMKDRYTGQPRGFGFVTYADPAVVDKVIEETHVINGKQVEIKRTIPKGASQTKDFKTKKIFVGGIPTTVTEDELKNFFSKYGKVVDHQIIRDHATNRSRGFGFVIFEEEQVVDDILAEGNMLDLAGAQVEIKKAEPKKASGPPGPAFGSSRGRPPFGDSFGGYGGTALFFIIFFTIPILLLLRSPPICSFSPSVASKSWSGDLRTAHFAWNHISFPSHKPPAAKLKLAVFTRKWPTGTAPGGMERHALTLHTALARRGHEVHIYTAPPDRHAETPAMPLAATPSPIIHYHDGPPGRWRYNEAWAAFEAEHRIQPFDAVHSESVALPHWRARELPNLAVTWHGIALEGLQSDIFQDLARKPNEPMSSAFNKSLGGVVLKVLNEIRFFKSYAHHVAISDSSGEMLRDVYQIPNSRVHVILNGIDENDFGFDTKLGIDFRAKIGVPQNASLVMGVAGRLVKDKGHPLLHEAFSKLMATHLGVYLIVVGSGPWEQRYKDLGPRVKVLGSMSPDKLKAFYNSLDIFVNPTLRPQGLDLTLMEAMRCGKPVLATGFPSIRGSIVVNEEFGFTFVPNVESLMEALETMVDEGSEKLARRGRLCSEYASSVFTAQKMALAYERLFLCVKNETYCKYPLP